MHGKFRVVQLVIWMQKLMTRIFPFKFIIIIKRIFPLAAGKFRVKLQTFPWWLWIDPSAAQCY
jgi:hypothetical protein